MIVTTSFDALVERALDGVGMVPGRDYEIVDLLEDAPDFDTTPVTVIKAYGGRLPRSGAMADALDAECVVVGPGPCDPPLVHALAYPGGPLWWVSQAPLQSHDERAYRATRDLYHVRGPAGDPDRFFAELSLRLLQLPSIVAQRAYDEGTASRPGRSTDVAAASVSDALAKVAGSVSGTEAEVDDFERLLLQTRIDRCRDAVRRLEQRGGGELGDEVLDSQLAYQRRQLTSLEERLHARADPTAQLPELLRDVKASMALELDPRTLDYVDGLVAYVDDELKRAEPNDAIVGSCRSGRRAS